MKPTRILALLASSSLLLQSCRTYTDPLTGATTSKPDASTVTPLIELARDIFLKRPAPPVAVEVTK